jgi:excisionase family DNA binding protein
MGEGLLKPEEAAHYLNIDKDKFYQLVEKYKIPYYKIADKFIRFSASELEEYRDKIKTLSNVKISSKNFSFQEKKSTEVTLKDKIWELIRFNDFYILSFILILILLYYIIFH